MTVFPFREAHFHGAETKKRKIFPSRTFPGVGAAMQRGVGQWVQVGGVGSNSVGFKNQFLKETGLFVVGLYP